MINLTFTAAEADGEIDCPVFPGDDPTDRAVIERAARRAFWSIIARGYGDIDDVKVFYNGEWIPMGPQKESSNAG